MCSESRESGRCCADWLSSRFVNLLPLPSVVHATLQSTRPPTLEIRLGEHAPNFVYLKDRRRIDEPPSIEGYLDSIKPNKQTKQPVYLATHSGYLFFINPGRPFPPTPPGAMPIEFGTKADTVLRHMEVRRGINQIVHATSMMDLRTIVAIRRAFQPVSSKTHTVKEVQDDDRGWFDAWVEREERPSEDDVDEGGEAALAQAYDIPLFKMRRSFELLLDTGQVMRFEVISLYLLQFPIAYRRFPFRRTLAKWQLNGLKD